MLYVFCLFALIVSPSAIAATATATHPAEPPQQQRQQQAQVEQDLLSPLIENLNRSADMTLLTGSFVLRYHSSAAIPNTKTSLDIQLTTRQLKYRAANTAMFAGNSIPEAVPYLRATINLCDVRSIAAQLPGTGAFGKKGSDAVLAVELGGLFTDYQLIEEAKANPYQGNEQEFTFYIRSENLLELQQQLQQAKIQYCDSGKILNTTLKSLFQGGEISLEQAKDILRTKP